eukprot:6008216-Prymnesium_polylepis.1
MCVGAARLPFACARVTARWLVCSVLYSVHIYISQYTSHLQQVVLQRRAGEQQATRAAQRAQALVRERLGVLEPVSLVAHDQREADVLEGLEHLLRCDRLVRAHEKARAPVLPATRTRVAQCTLHARSRGRPGRRVRRLKGAHTHRSRRREKSARKVESEARVAAAALLASAERPERKVSRAGHPLADLRRPRAHHRRGCDEQ